MLVFENCDNTTPWSRVRLCKGTYAPLYKKTNLLNNTCTKCHYWLILIKGTLETTVPSMWRPRRWGRGAASGYGMVVGFGLKTCVMWGLWRSCHNGLASLNSNLHSSQREHPRQSGTSSLPSVRLSLWFCLHLTLSSPTVLHLSDRLSIPHLFVSFISFLQSLPL